MGHPQSVSSKSVTPHGSQQIVSIKVEITLWAIPSGYPYEDQPKKDQSQKEGLPQMGLTQIVHPKGVKH